MPQYMIRPIKDDGKIDESIGLVVAFPGNLMDVVSALSAGFTTTIQTRKLITRRVPRNKGEPTEAGKRILRACHDHARTTGELSSRLNVSKGAVLSSATRLKKLGYIRAVQTVPASATNDDDAWLATDAGRAVLAKFPMQQSD